MFNNLQMARRRDRLLVGLADLALRPLGWRRRRDGGRRPRRILLLRLERIGDLLMVTDAIGLARDLAPEAEIDLAVGTWNAELAALVRGIDRIDIVDVPWLAREGRRSSWPALVRHARGWRRRAYDLVVNFEPDIRSNFLAWLSGAPRRTGYWTGGGGAFLTDTAAYEPAVHVRSNAEGLVRRSLPEPAGRTVPMRTIRLEVPGAARARADGLLAAASAPLLGVHASGGRPSKQWHPGRFADAARELAQRHAATIVLTGSPPDRPLVDAVSARLHGLPVIDLCGRLDLATLAAVLGRLDLFVTGDTGPMHLAAAVGTPLVALFGPSDPRRYGPVGSPHEVLRIDLPCSPCGMVRLPPVRCRNRVPECLDGIGVDEVVAAGDRLLAARRTVHT